LEILENEYNSFIREYQDDFNEMTASTLAMTLLHNTTILPEAIDDIRERVSTKFPDAKLTFEDFKILNSLLLCLDEFAYALQVAEKHFEGIDAFKTVWYSDKRSLKFKVRHARRISNENFKNAMEIAAKVTVPQHLADICYVMMDVNGDGGVDSKEVIMIMKARLNRGLQGSEDCTSMRKCVNVMHHQYRLYNQL